MKNTSFKVEHFFGDVSSKESLSTENIFKLNNFLAKNCEYKHKNQN